MDKSAENINFRLKEERNRLGLKQQHVIDVCGVSKRTVIAWEKDVSIPSDKLAMLVGLKFDVQYVLTGVRSCNLNHVAEEAPRYQSRGGGSVSQEEKGILDLYRELRPADRTHARAVIDALACKNLKKGETG